MKSHINFFCREATVRIAERLVFINTVLQCNFVEDFTEMNVSLLWHGFTDDLFQKSYFLKLELLWREGIPLKIPRRRRESLKSAPGVY